MATTTISVSRSAYNRLKRFKAPGDSFSDVILRELPCFTAGEVLDRLGRKGVPKADPELEKTLQSGRGRRSSRRL